MTTGGHETGTELLRDGCVAGPWTCLGCRYSIEHLRATDPCPECGHSLDPSLDPRLLRFAPPATIDRVRRGARGIELSVLAAVLSAPAIGVYFATVDAMDSYGLSLEISYFLNGPLFPFILVFGVMAMLARSVFKFTTPLPASCAPTRAIAQLRRVLRAFVIMIPAIFSPFAIIFTLEWLGAYRFDNSVPEWIPILCASTLLGVVVSLVLGVSLYAWSIGDRTWAYGKPLRAIASAPLVFAALAASLALAVGALSEPMFDLTEDAAWGFLQWAFFTLWLAWILFAAFTALFSLFVVDAARSATKRDFREASAARQGTSP